MATTPESNNQGNSSIRNPSPFHYFGNISAPYIATLSLLEFTIGLLVWLFSTPMVPNVQIAPQPNSPPPGQHQPQVDPKVNPLPSSPIISSSLSSSSPRESPYSSNQEVKKKKKRTMKKKKNK